MIKGKATIQLFDEKSGEVVKELHEENMITNAVDTILNPPDYIEIGMDSDNDRSFNLLRDFAGNIADTAFRGVIGGKLNDKSAKRTNTNNALTRRRLY